MLRACALGLLACAILLAVTLLALQRGLARDLVRQAVQAGLGETLGGQLALGSLEGPLYPELRIQDLRFASEAGQLEVASLDLRYRLAYRGGQLAVDVETLRVEAPELRLQTIDLGDSDGASGAAVDLPVRVERLELVQGRVTWPALQDPDLPAGEARLDLVADGVDLSGGLLPREASARLSWAPLRALGRELSAGEAEIAWREGRLEHVSIRGGLEGARLDLEGSVDTGLPGGAWRGALRGTVADLDLGRVSPFPALRSQLAGQLALELDRAAGGLRGSVTADLRGIAQAMPIERLEVALGFAPGAWQLTRARLVGQALRVEATGDGQRMVVDAEVPDLAQLRVPGQPLLELAGSARLESRLDFTSGEVLGSARLHAERLVVARRAFGDLEADLVLDPAGLEVRSARLADRSGRIELEGRFTREGPEDLTIQVSELALPGLEPLLGLEARLEGRLDARLAATGTWSTPRVAGSLDVMSPRLGALEAGRLRAELAAGERLSGGAQLEGLFGGDLELRLDAPRPLGDPRALDLAAWLQTVDLEGAARAVKLAELERALGLARPLGVEAPTGEITVTGRLAGWPPRSLAADVTLRGIGLLYEERPLGPFGGAARVEGRTSPAGIGLRISGALDGPEASTARFSIELPGPLRTDGLPEAIRITDLELSHPAGRLRLAGELRAGRLEQVSLDLGGLALDSLPIDLDLGGVLDAQLELSGTLGRPRVDGRGTWAGPRIGAADLERVAWNVTTAESEVEVEASVDALGQTVARAHVIAPRTVLELDGPGWLKLDGTRLRVETKRLDVRLFQAFLPRWLKQPTGTVELDLTARVEGAQPRLDGRLELADAGFRVPALGQRFGPLRGRLALEGEVLRVDDLILETPGGGRAEVRGETTLEGVALGEVALDARFDRLALARLPDLRFDLAGEARVEGRWDRGVRFGGDMRLEEARIGTPAAGDPIWSEIQIMSEGAVESRLRESAALDGVDRSAGSLTLHVPPKTWVRAAGAELEIVGDVELRKEVGDEPRFFGELEVRRGRYQLGRRVLAFERGTASLTGTPSFDPTLDVVAATRVREYRVEVRLGGRVSSPNLELQSDPPLPRNDVLALLLFGRPSNELEASRAIGLELVLSQLGAEIGVDDLRARLARHLPFDTFAVELGEDNAGATVEVGRYVGDDVFVRYKREVGAEGSDEIGVEWQLSPSVKVRSEASSGGSSGADVIWEKDY